MIAAGSSANEPAADVTAATVRFSGGT